MKLEACEVSKRYSIPVLEAASLQAEKGEFVCLLGPNRCGKTTLLRILGGLEPPSAGEVRVDGRPIAYGGVSSLDAQNRRIIQAEIRRTWTETGKTIVFAGHAIEEAVSAPCSF